MTVCVVDLLETVEVEEQQRQRPAAARRALRFATQDEIQIARVVQAASDRRSPTPPRPSAATSALSSAMAGGSRIDRNASASAGRNATGPPPRAPDRGRPARRRSDAGIQAEMRSRCPPRLAMSRLSRSRSPRQELSAMAHDPVRRHPERRASGSAVSPSSAMTARSPLSFTRDHDPARGTESTTEPGAPAIPRPSWVRASH